MNGLSRTPLVALPPREPGAYGRRRLRPIHAVAVLCSLIAAFAVYTLFDQYRLLEGPGKGDRQLVASVDLRIGNPASWAERGQAAARADIEAGLLQLQVFGPDTAPGAPKTAAEAAEEARAKRWKASHGITWVRKAKSPTPLTQAYADAYNRAMQTEIERRHGAHILDKLLREQREAFPLPDKQDAP